MTAAEIIKLAPDFRRAGIQAVSLDAMGHVTGVQFLPETPELDRDWPVRDLVMNIQQEQDIRDGR